MGKKLGVALIAATIALGATACGTPDLEEVATQNNCVIASKDKPDDMGQTAECLDGRSIGVFNSNKDRDVFRDSHVSRWCW